MDRTRKIPFFNPYEPLKFALRALVSQWHIALCFMLLYGAATFLIDKNIATSLVENTAALGTNKPWLFLVLTIIFSVFSFIFLITSALSWYKTGKISLGALFEAPLMAWFFLFLMSCIEMFFEISYLVGPVSGIFFGIALLYLKFKTLFVERYLVDKNSSLAGAIKKSFELTYRYKWRFIESLFLYTAFFGIIIFVGIPVGICALFALFFSIPFEQVAQNLRIVTYPILKWIMSFAITYVYCKIMADYENNEQERIGDSVDQKSVTE